MRYEIRDAGYEIRDAGYEIRDTGCGNPISRIPYRISIAILFLLLFSSIQLHSQVAWEKKGGVCFRVDDNQDLWKFTSFDSVFAKYNYKFCAAICLESATFQPGYIEGLKQILANGHEFMDHAPSHSTNLIQLKKMGDTVIYTGSPYLDHINTNFNLVCFKWESVDTTHIQGEGLVNVNNNLVISDLPGEFQDLYNPEHLPMLFFPLTNQVYTWTNLQNVNPLDPDSLTLRSFWEEGVDLGIHLNISYHKLTSFDVKMPSEVLVMLGERVLSLCDTYNMEHPKTWIQPYGNYPLLTRGDVALTMGAQLAYTGGATYQNETWKTYNEYNPQNDKQFGMMWGDFSTTNYSVTENKKLIANTIAKHRILISQNHFLYNTPTWQTYLQHTDSLLAWITDHNIPVLLQREWTSELFDSLNNPSFNIFPLLQTDLNGDEIPDGYDLENGVMIHDDGVTQSENKSVQVTSNASFFNISGLGGLEKGTNTFTIYTKGDLENVIRVSFFYPETGSNEVLTFTINSPEWTQHSNTVNIPENISAVDIEIACQYYTGGEVRISGMELRGTANPVVMHESFSLMTNQQFPVIDLDTVIYDPNYSLQELTITITNSGVLQAELNAQAGSLSVNKPSSFWIGSDSLMLKAVNPDGGSDSSWLIFSATKADICKGQSVTLTLLNPPAGATFLWTADPPDQSLVQPTIPNPTVSPEKTTFYTIKVTAPLQIYTEELTVTVSLAGDAILSGPLPAYCTNAPPVQLYGTPPGGIFAGPGVIGDIFKPTLATIGINMLTYTVTGPAGCNGKDSLFVIVQPNPQVSLPPDTIVCHWQTVILDAGIGYDTYLWSTGELTPTVIVNSSGMSVDSIKQITLIVTKNGCPAFDTTLFFFKACMGIDDFTSSKLRVYPNPITSWLVIENLSSFKDITGTIMDILGEIKMEVKIKPGENRFEAGGLASGLYLLYIQSPGGTSLLRFIKLPE